VYRLEWTADFGRRWNVEHRSSDAIRFDERELGALPAVITWTLTGGSYTFRIEFSDHHPLVVTGGTYRVDGDRVSFDLLPDVGAGTNVARWRIGDDGELVLEQVDGRPSDPYFAVPWVRVSGGS
jgi:hypothetical protein